MNDMIGFKLADGYDRYCTMRINQYVPKVQGEEQQFSKLLLIL